MRWLFASALFVLVGCRHAEIAPLPSEAVLHRAKTSDGWEVSLVQYKAVGETRGLPVLLCHGISANGRNMDLDKDHSLARWFASQGRETWTLSLRGTGLSDRIDAKVGRKPGYDLDTLWREDLTTAIDYVRRASKLEKIDYVGHSMGGLLVYAYLSQGGQGLNAVATLGSPTKLDWQGRFESAGVRVANAVLNKGSLLPITTLSELGLYLQPESSEGVLPGMLVNPKNTTGATFKRLSIIGAGDLSGALALQLVAMIQNGGFKSANGSIDYRRDMGRIRVPVLVVAGKTDQIAIVPAVKDGYRALGGAKEWLLLSEENGVEADYGHLDYLIGERAAKELWPHVLAFLEKHRPAG